jgi:hypothetical protein
VLKLEPTTTQEALKPGVMEAKRLISANCGKEDPDELFQKANDSEELLKLVLAILHDEFFRDEAGEDIQIGDVTVKSFDIDNVFLFACGDNEMERMNSLRLGRSFWICHGATSSL